MAPRPRRDGCAWRRTTSCSLRGRAPPGRADLDRTRRTEVATPSCTSASRRPSLQRDGRDQGAVVAAGHRDGRMLRAREPLPDQHVVDLGRAAARARSTSPPAGQVGCQPSVRPARRRRGSRASASARIGAWSAVALKSPTTRSGSLVRDRCADARRGRRASRVGVGRRTSGAPPATRRGRPSSTAPAAEQRRQPAPPRRAASRENTIVPLPPGPGRPGAVRAAASAEPGAAPCRASDRGRRPPATTSRSTSLARGAPRTTSMPSASPSQQVGGHHHAAARRPSAGGGLAPHDLRREPPAVQHEPGHGDAARQGAAGAAPAGGRTSSRTSGEQQRRRRTAPAPAA